MTASAERLAKAFIDTRAALVPDGVDLDRWDELTEFARWFTTEVFAAMLSNRVIAVPERVTQRDIFAAPHEVAKDITDIENYLGGLSAMYAKAHDDVLSPSGGGEVSGRGSLVDVNPTLDQTIDGINEEESVGWQPKGGRAAARARVRKTATQIREARNKLYGARQSLREQTETTVLQPKRVDTKALIPQEQLDEALSRKAEG